MYHDSHHRGRIVGLLEARQRFPNLSTKLWRNADNIFPVRVTRSWFQRVRAKDDPLGLQAFPHSGELEADPYDSDDPVGEFTKMPDPWLVQKHADRILLLTTKRCHFYCRYCFRRTHDGPLDPTEAELENSLAFINQSSAQEVILSGGDPLAIKLARLDYILENIKSKPIKRIHTRAPVTEPAAVTEDLIRTLKKHGPLWVVIHCNHPDELNDEVQEALAALVDAGIPVLNQSVLLQGVNDDPDVLAELFTKLLQYRIFPYYLHHPDSVTGNAHFRLSLERGLAIYMQVASRISGIALPRYVIDPPDGSGKIDVATFLHRRSHGHASCNPKI